MKLRQVLLVTLISLLLAACNQSALQPNAEDPLLSTTAFPGENGLIVFSSNRSGNFEIYTMKPDGSGLTQLTNDPDADTFAAWSPDGSRIAFARTSGPAQAQGTYLMNADGSGMTQLTQTGDRNPNWSPDGTKILLDRLVDGSTGNRDIFIMNDDGSGQINLTNSTRIDFEPSWSPDGTKIVFVGSLSGNHNIYVMNADGSNQTNLTNIPTQEFRPSWSPDGSQIAFSRNVATSGFDLEIHVMNADGSGVVQLTNTNRSNSQPAWSPDGSQIVFTSTRDSNHEIYLMNADGSGQVKLSNSATVDEYPDWQPILNRPPTAEAGGPYNAEEGQATSLNGSATDPDGDSLSYSWRIDSDDCRFDDATLEDPTLTCTVAGNYTLSLAVSDGQETATDSAAVTITEAAVSYDFSGFFRPVKNLPKWNYAKARRTVPIKFSLNGYQGLDILVDGSPYSQQINCRTGEVIGSAEPTNYRTRKQLYYSKKWDTYFHFWKTEKRWKRTCREFVLALDDGSEHKAKFYFW